MSIENIYTSTGVKFWRHPMQMISFAQNDGHSVITTHISPTGKCNLNCSYCSVSKRRKKEEIDPNVIYRYLRTLAKRGLRGVIITGGGEPTQYSQWDKLVSIMMEFKSLYRIHFGLITNGVDLDNKGLGLFDWIRISLNYGQEKNIILNREHMYRDVTVGLSLIYAGVNKAYSIDHLNHLISRLGAEYLRILPDCRQEDLNEAHKEIDKFIHGDSVANEYPIHRIFHQMKYHDTPIASYCPQAYIRPYLSEIDGGTVFPCDSIVLNSTARKFEKKYAICKAEEVGDFLDGKIQQKFNPSEDCKGCVFSENVEMLRQWRLGGSHQFHKYTREIKHERFV